VTRYSQSPGACTAKGDLRINGTALNYPETLPVSAPGRGERTKGGEKTKSEWEKLEKLTKDELIIELVKERRQRLELLLEIRSIADNQWFPVSGCRDGQKPPDGWARKIALYAAKTTPADDQLHDCDLQRYGMTEESSESVFAELCKEGLLDWPSYDPRSKRHTEDGEAD